MKSTLKSNRNHPSKQFQLISYVFDEFLVINAMLGDIICLLTPKIMSRDAWKFNSTNRIRIVSLENKNLYIKGQNALFNNRSYLEETLPDSIQWWWTLWKSILFSCGSGEVFNLFFGKGSKYICCQRETEAKLRPCLARSLNKDLKRALI